jgi:broad specificity phosphatase PhoE
MKKTIFLLFIIAFSIGSKVLIAQSDQATTLLFIRHAEKTRDGNADPGLTEQGKLRAIHWAEVFKDAGLDAVFSTDTKRTKSTAKPTANEYNFDVVVYNTRTIDIVQFAIDNQGKTILVVGHSNTIPNLVNALLGKEKYSQIEDNNNSNLYVVTIVNGESKTTLLHVDQ